MSLSILGLGTILAAITTLLPILLLLHLNFSKGQITLFFIISTLFSIVITFVSGYLSDLRVSRWGIIAVGGTVATLGYASIASSQSLVLVYLSGLLAVGTSVIFPQLFAVSRERLLGEWEDTAQVMGMTFLRMLFSLGYVFGAIVASLLIQAMPIRTLFLLISASIAGLTLFSIITVRKIDTTYVNHKSHYVAYQPTTTPTKTILISTFLPVFVALVLMRGSDNARLVYLPLVNLHVFNDMSIAPLMFGLSAGFEIIFLILVGYLSSLIGERHTIITGALAGIVYFVIMASTTSLTVLFFAQIIYAFFISTLFGVGMTYVQGLIPSRVGLGGSLYMNAMQIGSLIGLVAPLFVAGYTPAVFLAPAGLCAAATILLLVVRGHSLFGSRTENMSANH